jgi:hypothetical protein
LFIALYVGLGIILLSHTDTLPFWRLRVDEGTYNDTVAGLPPFNASLAAGFEIDLFFFDWKDGLSNPFKVWPISPMSCSGEYCLSLFLPGTYPEILLTPNATGDSVVLYDIPGYQIEFYPMSSTDPSFDIASDCKYYDVSQNVICMKSVGNDILLGIAWSQVALTDVFRCASNHGRSSHL